MGFWDEFANVWSSVWRFMDSSMTFGGLSISFSDILVTSVLTGIVIKIVADIIYDERG